MERLIIDVTLQCSTLRGACRILRISWDEAWGVMSRAVARGRARKPARLVRYYGVDEKAFRKGQRYHTVVCDLDRATVEWVGEGRRAEDLAPFYAQLTPAQREAIDAVAMDMWDAYIRATREGLPNGGERIVFDRFHAMQHVIEAVDTVRKQEHRMLGREGAPSALTGTKYLWLYSRENLPTEHAARFTALQHLQLKVGRAWAIKEALRKLWTYRQRAAARRYFQRWYGWARRSRLEPMRKAAATLRTYVDGVLRFCQHPISNGVTEGLNSKIMAIKRKACGFRNADHFTTAIYFHCGGLDLYPR
jgi:transposase